MNWSINHTFELTRGHPQPSTLTTQIVEMGDSGSHSWNVALTQNGEAADITGAGVTGYFVRADGNTVVVQGSASGNVASVTTAATCFAIEGICTAVMKITHGGATFTADICLLNVRKDITDSYVDPGDIIDIQSVMAMINDMETARQACVAAAAATYTLTDDGSGIVFTQPATA